MELLAGLSGERGALWRRLQGHSFEEGKGLSFAQRLARERRWTVGFARGAIGEYRKFCFLAVTAGEACTPSVEVDEVWHLHLIYSRDYWDVWCGQVLGIKLHHDPTPGGKAAAAAYREQYARTLLAYELVFGPPPAAYWPAGHVRFGRLGWWRRWGWRA
jgi:hypothetical protein